MPTFVYKCNDCNSKYEVFHKVKEVAEDVICPSCESNSFTRLVTAANIGGFAGKSSFSELPAYPTCNTGGCQTGMCGLN